MNKILHRVLAGGALLLAAACSTPEARIHGNQAAFDAWPADVREKIRAGRIDLGFTPEMVQLALGEADHTLVLTTEKGSSVVWIYRQHALKFSVGLGVSETSGSSAYGGSMATGGDADGDNKGTHVVFEGGKVIAIETSRK